MLKSLLVVAIEMTAIPRRGKLLGTRSACQPIDNAEYILIPTAFAGWAPVGSILVASAGTHWMPETMPFGV